MGLDWSAVDFGAKLLRVTPETSKVRRTRIIEMHPALVAWLALYRKTAGPVGIETKSQFSFYMHRKACGDPPEKDQEDKRPVGLLAAAGVKWIQDGPRKTFASMHYAAHGDAAKLAAILGHTGGYDVLFRHYRGLATKADARAYFAIRPQAADGNVVRFKREAG